jgi:hypothetical protein
MKLKAILMVAGLMGMGCAQKATYDDAMLEKYPKCYHGNMKIYKKCIEKNEAGEAVTALELENTAYPGQYK